MKGFKKVLAFVLAGTMVMGSSLTVLADDPSSTGAGSYEGNKMEYPTLSVSLPTFSASDKTYDYLADPNGNIAKTGDQRDAGFTFEGDTGIYFKTDATNKKYTATSANYTAENQNGQDIIVTAEMTVATAGATSIVMSDDPTFEGDTVKDKTALYLALQNGAKTKIAPLTAGTAGSKATISMVVKGNKDNYEPKYNASASGNKYSYVLKSGDNKTWNKCVFNLTGALNKNVAWTTADITFPSVTVTYSYAAVPVMTGDKMHGYEYTWSTGEPSGTILAVTIDGVERPVLATNGKVTYSNKKLAIDPAPVTTFGLGEGNHQIVVKIGTAANGNTPASGTDYTLNIEN
jgi:hypothetical protein